VNNVLQNRGDSWGNGDAADPIVFAFPFSVPLFFLHIFYDDRGRSMLKKAPCKGLLTLSGVLQRQGTIHPIAHFCQAEICKLDGANRQNNITRATRQNIPFVISNIRPSIQDCSGLFLNRLAGNLSAAHLEPSVFLK
jgi:hypothetical protein